MQRGERGSTLIEMLVAMIILGVVAVAGLETLTTALSASAEHRQLGALNSLLKSYVETATYEIEIQPSALFTECASGYSVSFPIPSAYAGYAVGLSGIEYFDSSTGAFDSTCASQDETGLQLLQAVATSPGGATANLSFVVRNPNYPSGSASYAGF